MNTITRISKSIVVDAADKSDPYMSPEEAIRFHERFLKLYDKAVKIECLETYRSNAGLFDGVVNLTNSSEIARDQLTAFSDVDGRKVVVLFPSGEETNPFVFFERCTNGSPRLLFQTGKQNHEAGYPSTGPAVREACYPYLERMEQLA